MLLSQTLKSLLHNDKKFLALLFLLALAGASIILYATPWGPWTIEDSIDYFDAARNFAAGRGLVHTRASGNFPPMHIHPPFYSIVLSITALLHLELLDAARWLNAGLFAGAILLLGFGVQRLTNSPRLGVLFSLIFLTSTAMINNYTGAMAEGLYFVLGFASLVLLMAYLQKPRLILLAATGLLAGLALLTRFSGAAFIGAGLVGLTMWGRSNLKHRLVDLAVFALLSALPYGLWFLYLRIGFPGVTTGYYDWSVQNIWETIRPVRGALMDGAWEWLGLALISVDPPYRMKLGVLIFLAFIGITLTILAVKSWHKQEEDKDCRKQVLQLSVLLFSFALLNILILAFTYAVVLIPKPSLNERILSPIGIGLVLSVLAWLEFLIQTRPGVRIARSILWVFTFLLIMFTTPRSFAAVQELRKEGFGYTSREWLSSELIEHVRNLPSDIVLISNQPAPVFFLTGRPSYDMFSHLIHLGPNDLGVKYGDRQEDPNQVIFRSGKAALILFEPTIYYHLGEIYGETVGDPLHEFTTGLTLYARAGDGFIYFYPYYR